MSLTELRRDAVSVRLSRKRDIHGRHKEILTELFYFAKNPDVPPDSQRIAEFAVAEASDLKDFLAINDPESGHIFQESTLPKVRNVAVNASVESIEQQKTLTKATTPAPQTPQPSNSTGGQPLQPVSTGTGRMVTRVSSGAIRHKSVGELLGGTDYTPKSTPSRSTEIPPVPSNIDAFAAGFQETSLSQKQPSAPTRPRGTVFQETTPSIPSASKVELDRLQAAAEIVSLNMLVTKAHKSVRTQDYAKAINEKEIIAIVNRITQLKEQGLWSLRQPAKQKTPPRRNVHWDYLLKEMEWMSTDFYEERKFKMAGAFLLAKAVREYHESSDREKLLHKWRRRLRTPVKHFEEEVDADEDVLMVNHRGSASPAPTQHDAQAQPKTEEVQVNGNASDSMAMHIDGPSIEPHHDPLPTPPSSCELDDLPAIFDLPSDVIYATVNELPRSDGTSLSQLPLYAPPVVTDEPYRNPIDDLPIVPVSKFCLERYYVPVKSWEPRNRHYRQMTPESDDEMLDISREVQVEAIPTFAPAGNEAAPTRRRPSPIVIRPPAPPTHWAESRSSPWTPEEERMLLQLAKDNMYNFELVASALAFCISSVSDLEKRTAWECFEKFRQIYPEPQNIQLYGPNRNAAMNWLEKRNRMSISGTNKQKTNAIIRQPRLELREHRYLDLFDVMKKSAKNREKAKAQEKPQVKKPKDNLPTKQQVVPTPLDLSRLKAERDRAYNQAILAERQAQAVRLQMPPGTSPEVQEEVRRQWVAQQQAILNAQASGQALRANPGLGRGLLIPGGPNARQLPIRPNAGANPVPGAPPRPNPEQMQKILQAQARQMTLVNQTGPGATATSSHIQRMVQARALQQAAQQAQQHHAQLNAPQGNVVAAGDYVPFPTQSNGTPGQAANQVGNVPPNNRAMQPPQNTTVPQGPAIRQTTPQQQIQLPPPAAQALRATPPRPTNLGSPTVAHFPGVGTQTLTLQAALQYVQLTNPGLSLPDATKLAIENLRMQAQSLQNAAGANNAMQQHVQQPLAKSSPTQANQQIRRSPSQNPSTPLSQGQRM